VFMDRRFEGRGALVKTAAGRLSLHSSMQTVCPWIEPPDVLDSGVNPVRNLGAEASKIASIPRYLRLSSTTIEQTEPSVNRECTN
jgi:hypothetical protein